MKNNVKTAKPAPVDEAQACRRKKYDSEGSRRCLLSAAMSVFSKEGYDAATTRAIAKRAGINESLIQRYFGNKLGLFIAVAEQFKQRMGGALPYAPAATLEEELRAFLEFRLEFSRREKKLIRIVMSRSLVSKSFRESMGQYHQNGVPALIERLAELQRGGHVRTDMDLVTMSRIVGGMAFSLSLTANILLTTDAERVRGLVDAAVTTLARGLAPEAEPRPGI